MDENNNKNNSTNGGENKKSGNFYFDPYYGFYPAVITEIKVKQISENDCDIAFVFIVSNGEYRKKFYKICRHIFTDGQKLFRNFYLSSVLSDDEWDSSQEEYEAIIQEYKEDADLNELIGNFVVVSVSGNEYVRSIEDAYPCTIPEEDRNFKTLFDGIISQISTVKVPAKINIRLKDIMDKRFENQSTYQDEEYIFTKEIKETDEKFDFEDLSNRYLSDVRISRYDYDCFGRKPNISDEILKKCGKYTFHLKDTTPKDDSDKELFREMLKLLDAPF